MFHKMIDQTRSKRPVIHNLTNFVTANDCANILLACGASPVMSYALEEAMEITGRCDGLVINTGTIQERSLQIMLASGKAANEKGIPIVLDPVGIGLSRYRRDIVTTLLKELRISVIRGNISEIYKLAQYSTRATGIDADPREMVSAASLDRVIDLLKDLSRKTSAVLVTSGAIDLVSDADRVTIIYNGHPMMRLVSGTGCQLSSMMCAYVASNEDTFLAASSATIAMGVCGEIAHERLSADDGNAAYRNYIIDAVYNLTEEELERRAKYEIR